jgi:ribosomal-protein-alanine N-acetyltransferase
LSKQLKKAEIGFWLLPEFWGKGYMQEAMPLICERGFNKLGLERIEGFVETENFNCKEALEKLQFKYEGTAKDCELKNGKLISIDTYLKFK